MNNKLWVLQQKPKDSGHIKKPLIRHQVLLNIYPVNLHSLQENPPSFYGEEVWTKGFMSKPCSCIVWSSYIIILLMPATLLLQRAKK